MFITINIIIGYGIDLSAVEFQQSATVGQLEDSNDAFILMQRSQSIINNSKFIIYSFVNLLLIVVAYRVLNIKSMMSNCKEYLDD